MQRFETAQAVEPQTQTGADPVATLPRLASGGLPDDVGLVLCRPPH